MQCPGQDSRYWTGSAVFEIACEKCGATMEFFRDDSARVCKNCKHRMLNPQLDLGCASYCPYAEQCLSELPAELLQKKQQKLVEQVEEAVKKLYGANVGRMARSRRVARQAAQIAALTPGASPAVVQIAAYLHDFYQASEASGEASGTIRKLLAELKVYPGLVEEICAAVSQVYQPLAEAKVDFTILAEAHRQVDKMTGE